MRMRRRVRTRTKTRREIPPYPSVSLHIPPYPFLPLPLFLLNPPYCVLSLPPYPSFPPSYQAFPTSYPIISPPIPPPSLLPNADHSHRRNHCNKYDINHGLIDGHCLIFKLQWKFVARPPMIYSAAASGIGKYVTRTYPRADSARTTYTYVGRAPRSCD